MGITCPNCQHDNPDDSAYCGKCSLLLNPTDEVILTKTIKTPAQGLDKGKTIAGKYKIIERLGSGGMGVVYKALDLRLERTVALKFLPQELTHDPDARERFIQEAKAASALEHNNICTIHEIDETEDKQVFISMACYEGESLKERLLKGTMDPKEALDIAIQTAQGLAKAHSKGIVHRDIKPSNLMITEDGVVKIVDFGLAKLGDQARLTRTGTTMGTVAYMSPEQADAKTTNHQTDIWSLGVVLFEMLTGELPFEGEKEASFLYSIVHKDPRSMKEMVSGISEDLEEIVNRALAKNLEDRYQNMDELLADLKLISEGLHPVKKGIIPHKEGSSIIKRAIIFASIIAVLALMIIIVLNLFTARPGVIDSIAVLPFEITKTEPDPDMEFICDSISQDLINKLAPLSSIKKVIAWDSVRVYKGKKIDSIEVGEKLDVKAVLKNRVERRGESFIVSAELIRTSDKSHIWGDQFRFRQNVSEIFNFQEDVSDKIIKNLKLRLSGEEQFQLTTRYTENTEAYLDYQRGVVFLERRSPEALETAIEWFSKAIDLDPDFAQAYWGLSCVYAVQGSFYIIPSREAYSKAKEEAQRALEIDDKLALAHAELAGALAYGEWDWNGAEEEFQKAITLNSGDPVILQIYGQFLVYMGLFEEGIAKLRKAVEIDPISLPRNMFLGFSLHLAGRYDESIQQLKKTIELYPNSAYAHYFLSWPYFRKSMRTKALAEVKKAIAIGGRQPMFLVNLGRNYVATGEKDMALEILDELKDMSKQEYVAPTLFVWFYIALGQIDKAIIWLEKAYEERDHGLIYLNVIPPVLRGYDALRSDPRYLNLLRRMNFPDVD
jgi:serine/threonine-protein kinase